jgi:hypothetical protein
MQVLIRRSRPIAVLATALVTACWSGAFAQMPSVPGQVPAGVGRAAAAQSEASQKPAPALPSAIPGAKARGPVAPATKNANDMDPNEALFDAINRGDIGAARDALNRGAELNATNVLGMTPMELSVDLGRNDISFLLLSMRGEGGGSERQGKPIPLPSQANSRPAPVASKTPAKTRPAPAPRQTAVAERPPAAPKLYAGDGGTPQPSAGFLGFGR